MPYFNRLGATVKDGFTEFAVYSKNAQKIDLCLFSEDEKKEERLPMAKGENHIWYARIPGNAAGQKYGYRADGKFNPSEGLFYNYNKLLVDPYAKEISRPIDDWENRAFSYHNNEDSAFLVPKSVVVVDNPQQDSERYPFLTRSPDLAWEDIITYEAHVKGFTFKHPGLPQEIRGKFLALSHPLIINHLKELGVNNLELLPLTAVCPGLHLKKEQGFTDYWGYNPINFFALNPEYGTREELKYAVSELHKNGIAVTADFVYNHTGEQGDAPNPDMVKSLCFTGLDAQTYYKMSNGYFVNTTGCGNSFNVNKEPARQMLEDSLMYFKQTMGIDGVRFDLAGNCAQDERQSFRSDGAFLATARKVSERYGLKISGEPWSAMNGYYLGQMHGMMEWSDKYESAVRRFYKGDYNVIGELASHIAGSDHLWFGQKKTKFVHYAAAHDGFTAYDTVHYDQKNNYANGENNRDGSNDNHSSASPNEDIAYRRIKSMYATTILSRGTPMILGGDEIGRTQNGNNNAYCQDNEISWHNWENMNDRQKDLFKFMCRLNALRSKHEVFANLDIFSGENVEANQRKDIEWIRPDGKEMESADWDCGYARTLAYVINGRSAAVSPNPESNKEVVDDDFFVIKSGNEASAVEYTMPAPPGGGSWFRVFDTSDDKYTRTQFAPGDKYDIQPYAVAVFCRKKEESRQAINGLMQMLLASKQKTT